MKIEGFDELLADVDRLERELEEPASFYREHREEYYRQAAEITRRVLMMAAPQGANPHDWKRKVERIVDRVTAELLVGNNGIVFTFGADLETADGQRPVKQVMTYTDIEEWIKAGLEGVDGGKRITAIDEKVMAEKGIKGVASIVMKAYYSRNPDARYERLRRAIQRYFLGARPAAEEPLLDLVAAAWHAHFSVVIADDLERHAAELCRRFNKSGVNA